MEIKKFSEKVNESNAPKGSAFKMMKLFDVYDMPEAVKKDYYKKHDRRSRYNDHIVYSETYEVTDSYVEVKDGEEIYRDPKYPELVLIRGNDILSDWIFDNGGELFEELLIQS